MANTRSKLNFLVALLGIVIIQGCSGLGYQGGSIPTTFTGINQAQAVSPQTIQLIWTAFPGASKYNVYSPDSNDPIYTPSFNAILFQPKGGDASTIFQYSVTAMDPVTGKEQGVRSVYSPVQLLPHFNYQQSGTVAPISKTSLRVSWESHPLVNYMVYLAERLPSGVVDYKNFLAANQTVSGVSSALITGLLEGHEYCAVVVAAYSDQTNDTPDGTYFKGEVQKTLGSDAYLKGPSGSFGDSIIAQSQKCARTQSDFNASSIKIYTQKATVSTRPVFYVSVPGDLIEDTIGTVSTAIYQLNDVSGLATLIGSRVGTGKIASQSNISAGRYHFFAVVNDLSSSAQAKVEIIVGPTGSTPATYLDRQWVYVRGFSATEVSPNPTGYFPEKQQGGLGAQGAGTSVAVGDFNCDGIKDIAVGIPNASIMASDNRPSKQGSVVIYYGVSPTVGPNSPSTATTHKQTINFDITGFAGDVARDLRLGTSLYSGNFNGDNMVTNQFGTGLNSNYKCDDLVIGSGYGPMFVLYGKRDIAPGDGGLNYTGPTSYTLNPSASCDPTSNICQVAVYTQGTNYSSPLGLKITSGDYNGDGYEDLAVTSSNLLSSSTVTAHGIWVFRGSEYGLIPPNAFNDALETVVTPAGPHLGFPFLPATIASFALIPLPAPTAPGVGTNWGATGFGSSISTFHNAYYDTNAAKTAGTKRIRDVLMIGNSGSGLVHACLPESDYTIIPPTTLGTIGSTNDVNTSFRWDCSGTLNGPTVGSDFGVSMVDLKNPLRYFADQSTDNPCPNISNNEGFGNCSTTSTNLGYPGGIAVGSTTDAAVYVYYGLSISSANTLRDDLGLDRNKFFNKLLQPVAQHFDGTSMSVVNGIACSAASGIETCNIQKITHPTNNTGSFGSVLAALPGNIRSLVVAQDSKDTILAVAAPNRAITLSNGRTYTRVGSVQLFSQNMVFEANPIKVRSPSGNCTQSEVCRFADGFSNSLTTSLDYDGPIGNDINFGAGGIVAGPLFSSTSVYNSNSDIIVGTPGHVVNTISASGSSLNIIGNGAAITFFSSGGTYRNYQIADTGTNPSPWHILDASFSQESDIKFHQVVSIGDINQDGIGDVAVRINQGSQNTIRIYTGRKDKVGFNTSAGSYSSFQVQGDATAGTRFVPVGNIRLSKLPAFLVTGANASYLLFDGIGGIIGGFPTAFGAGGTPRKLFAPAAFAALGIPYLSFTDGDYYGAEAIGQLDSTLAPYVNFTHGDFNGDGYEDFAIGFRGSQLIQDAACPTTINTLKYCGDPNSRGRVFIFYGGADNGIQTQPDINGGYPLNKTFFTDYSADAGPTYSVLGPPCNSVDGSACKIQMISEITNTPTVGPTPIAPAFGQSITAVPAGFCISPLGVQNPVSSLIVQSTNNGVTSLYAYRPKCLDPSSNTNYSGLVSYAETSPAIKTLANPPGSSVTFGKSMTSVNNLMGAAPISPASNNLISHLVVTDQTNSRVVVYPIHLWDPSTAGTISPSTDLANGGRKIDYATSAMMSGRLGDTSLFGNGVAAIGDINGDGYGDLGIAISRLDRSDNASRSVAQGTILVLFGGPTGLQSHTNTLFTTPIEPSRSALCYLSPNNGAIPQSICNPSLIYAPQATNSIRNGAYERTSLMPYSFVNTGAGANSPNEGLGTFLFGVPGRDSLDDNVTNRILQGGAFYVLP